VASDRVSTGELISLGFEEQDAATSLISRYARSIDARDLVSLLECFTDEVSLSYDGGTLIVAGKAEAEQFFRNALRGPSTHLISNYRFERRGTDIVVSCSAIACVCRNPGFVTMRGLVYSFTCVFNGAGGRIRRLEHSATWECAVPGGAR
jgi:SnoaL-like domain